MMSQPLVVAQSSAMPVEPTEAFDAVFWMDAPTVFRHWHGPFPLIKAVTGDWTFAPSGTGTRWRGYARQSLEELSNQLVH